MLIPQDATIADEKIRDYLLVPLKANDKSGYITLAGLSRGRLLGIVAGYSCPTLPAEATFQYRNKFGDFFIARGVLHGPNGKRLAVRTIWVRDGDGQFRFITIRPDKREQQ